MKKLVYLCTLLLIILAASKSILGPKTRPITQVAITQIIEHPALDQEREGVLLALKDAGYEDGKNIKIIYQNAQGNMSIAAQIAHKIVSLRPEAIVAISTPSAQSILSVMPEKKIPLVFSAVSDPVEAKLVRSIGEPSDYVTGVSDYLPPESQLNLVRRLIPDIKRLGVIYNPGEANSVAAVQKLNEKAKNYQITLISATAGGTSEVAGAAQSLAGRADAIYIPNDNTAVAAIESIVRVGIQHRIPILAGDSGSVQRGAAAMAGYNRREMGRRAGEMVVRILKKESVRQIPVLYQHPIEIITNRISAEKMGVQLPQGDRL